MTKSTHGGPRTPGPGKKLGRKPIIENPVRITVFIAQSDRDWLATQAPTVAEAIRAIVKEKRKETNYE